MPEDALGYDDGVVDEHADRQHQAHHRQDHAVTGVIQWKDVDACHLRQLADFFYLGNYAIRHIHEIRARGLVYLDPDRVVPVEMSPVISLRGAQIDLRDIAQAQPVRRNHQVPDFLDRPELAA